ncbi:putative Kinesin-like protein bimC [Glarea lozoyensis 74030]|uniref:Kinesin-like protein n=1 Tax=Glarea lozoyensis (strain ATCC 74030 / MF5533) TaxID=1104152 RepID=H0EHS8_GLAL7|nr:putative Kinesin-like protein bimC [Glarea lozoyensis 74030]
MSGDMNETFGMLSDAAGIIPRALHALFNKLELDDAECSVKCSFIELYNEELRDLLSPDDNAKLNIYDDKSKSGHAMSTVVRGMEESYIRSAVDGIKLLQDGSHKRQVAATKCNDLSSRSHTVFTVTTYIKRTGDNGEDYLCAGKLNLVDLAGSENIQRSGAENKRAAEAGLINKNYAFRAKNIRNKPQINQTINKKTLLKEFTYEIEKLKSELIAARQRNGVYLANEAYEEMTVERESRRILCEEQAAKIETMETNLRSKVQELFSLTSTFMNLKKENEGTRITLDETKSVLEQTEFVLNNTRQSLVEETLLRKAHQETEEKLSAVGSELISTLGKTVVDVGGLHDKNRRKSDLQSLNRNIWGLSQAQVSEVTSMVETRVEDFRTQQQELMTAVSDRMQSFIGEELEKLSATQSFLESDVATFGESEKEVLGHSLGRDFKALFEELLKHVNAQKEEANTLRRQLTTASELAMQANIAAESKLDEVLRQEREQAATDRQNLLSQITGLVMAQGEKQDARLANSIHGVRQEIIASKDAFESSHAEYGVAMDSWNDDESKLVEEVLRSRETLKSKLKEDWVAANKHNSSLQTSTKSVHEESVRIVNEQMKDIEIQMQALDDFVSRARSQNAQHHDSHVQSLQALSTTVKTSYGNVGSHFNATYERDKFVTRFAKTA